MSKKGGYKIVSLGGLDLLDENLSLKGLYDALKNSYDKPILLTGIVIDEEKKKDALVQANEGANKIIIKNLYGYDLEVAKSGDAITVSETPDGIELPIPEPEDDGKVVKVNVQGKYVLGNVPIEPLLGKFVRIMDAPTSITLTNEQVLAIKEGIFFNGNLVYSAYTTFKNPIFLPYIEIGSDKRGVMITTSSVYNLTCMYLYNINLSNELTIKESGIRWNEYEKLAIHNLSQLNGKGFPDYPADTGTFTLKCVNGVLTWVQDQ